MVKDDRNVIYEMVDVEIGEFLYDLQNDPSETINLADQYPEIINRLKAYHENWLKEMQSQ